MLERFFAFIARHPRAFDFVIAAFWLVLSMSSHEVWDGDTHLAVVIPLLAVTGIALYWRRSHPLVTFGMVAAITVLWTLIDVDSEIPPALVPASYSLGAHAPERRLSIAGFVGFLVTGFAVVLITDPAYIPDTLFIVLVLTIAWVIGDSLRTRRQYQRSVLERAERAEALRDSLAHQAVAEERTRIARDLHDVVAHSMSLMVVQAGAARRVASTNPEASMAALEAIEAVGRNSLGEMRRILGVLRDDDDANARAPQPDIAAIDSLVDEFRSAGLPITVTFGGTKRPLSPSIELTAYRIVQESLTNTLKHAGASNTSVIIDFEEDTLRIEVEDDGSGTPSFLPSEAGSQRGHVGMRERITAFGGFFRARPRLDGGYLVSATLPLDESATTEPSNPNREDPGSQRPGPEPVSIEGTS